MNERQTELARQLVASKRWQFTDGMITACGLRICEGGKGYAIGFRSGPTRDGGGWYDGPDEGLIPDLDDPATLGCLLALVREAWGESRAYVGVERVCYALCTGEYTEQFRVFNLWSGCEYRDTEGEALAMALLEAP